MPAVQTQQSPAVTTAAYKQVQPMNGLLGGVQGQIGGLLGQQMELPQTSPGAYWLDVAANIDPMAPGLGGIAQGFSAANKNAFEQDLARTQMGTMSPYQQAQIQLQHQQQQYRQQQAAAAQQQAMAQQQQIMQAREIAAGQVDDPATKQLIRLGVMDGELGKLGRQAGAERGAVSTGYERTVDPETGEVRDMPVAGTEHAEKRRKEAAAMEAGLERVKTMRDLIQKHGAEGTPWLSDPEVSGQMSQLYSAIISDVARVRGMGVLEQAEREDLENRINDPSSFGQNFRGNTKTLAQYDSLITEFEKKLEGLRGDEESGSTKKADPLGLR